MTTISNKLPSGLSTHTVQPTITPKVDGARTAAQPQAPLPSGKKVLVGATPMSGELPINKPSPHDLENAAQSLEALAGTTTSEDASRILREAAEAAARVKRSVEVEAPLHVHAGAPRAAGPLRGTLERKLEQGKLKVTFKPLDKDERPFAVPVELVAGLCNGAEIELTSELTDSGEKTYRVVAGPEDYATAMVGRVEERAGQFVAVALRPTSPYAALPLANTSDVQALLGKTVVVDIHRAQKSAAVRVALDDGKNDLEDGFLAAAVDAGTQLSHSPEALAQAKALAENPPITGKDLTHIPFITIDGPHSMDLDQALAIERRPDGGFTFHYAIADVAHFIPRGSPLDVEASERGFTTYLPHTAIAMLPKTLSEGVISLLPDQKRRAIVATIELDKDGNIESERFERGVVMSRKKLAFGDVQQHLDLGDLGAYRGQPYSPSIDLTKALGEPLIQKDAERGVVTIAETDAEVKKHDGAYRLELPRRFMVEKYNEKLSVLTNYVVDKFLSERGVRFPHRVEEGPREADLQDFRRRTEALSVPWKQDESLRDYLARLDPKDSRTLPIRDMAKRLNPRATYDTRPLGHHALKLDHYAHFTAPMRRFPDFLVHRILAAVVEGTEVPYQAPGELEATLDKLDKAARRNGTIDRECTRMTQAHLLKERIGQTKPAVVMDVKPSGIVVRLLDPTCECDVLVDADLMSRLTKNTFALDSDGVSLWNGVKRFRIGDKLDVTIMGMNQDGRADVAPAAFLPELFEATQKS